MLHALRLHDYRSFADSGRIELSDVNIFIGPNSAGKSNIMTAIELALYTTERSGAGPLALAQVTSFGSFDSILRRPGKNRKSDNAEFALVYEWENFGARFMLRRAPSTGATVVHRAEYFNRDSPDKAVLRAEATDYEASEYRGHDDTKLKGQIIFAHGVPLRLQENKPRSASRVGSVAYPAFEFNTLRDTMIVRPHRPVPRSVYVLDDPMMNVDDSRLISDLLRLWSEDGDSKARTTIVENLQTMKLAVDIEARTIGRRKGPRTAEIRVSPRKKSEAATLADVGYGVSQILPLLSHDAQLTRGNLVAYQPEAHLHPLAQSRLADVFVASAERGNKVYVETHSEHLVTRLQALVAAGLDPAKVRVFCVEHDGKQSVVTTMIFDKQGIPKTRWPKGFLDTGLDLARDLAAKRREKTP